MRIVRQLLGAVFVCVLLMNSAFAGKTWYVGSGANAKDSVTNANNSQATPFRTLGKAATVVNPGDTVLIMNGTYSYFTVTRSGTSDTDAGRITWKAFPGHHPEIITAWWQAINVQASYQTFDGITFTGNNDNVNLADAEADMEIDTKDSKKYFGDPKFNNSGIQLDNRNKANKYHYLTVRNSLFRKFGCIGVATFEADYTVIENNKFYENAWYSRYGCSGASMFPANASPSDPNTGYRNIIRNNIFWNNKGLVKWRRENTDPVTNVVTVVKSYSDGNGFILDITADDYNGRTLITDNLTVNNGGSGIHAYKTRNVDIVNNTGYMNGTKVGYADIFAQSTTDAVIRNNIAYAREGGQVNSNSKLVNVTYDYNIYFNGTIAKGTQGANDIVADPKFVNPSIEPCTEDANTPTVTCTADFSLQGNSPAIDSGIVIAGKTSTVDINGVARPKGARIDRGAYEFNKVPAITSANSANAVINTAFNFAVAASNFPSSFAATGLPAGLAINATTGVISGTPTASGAFTVNVTASNAVGASAVSVLALKVFATPVVNSPLTKSGGIGTALNYQITATNTPTAFSATGLPAGLNVNTSTGLISGTPTTAAVSNVTIGASNPAGSNTKTLVLTVVVAAPVINSALTKAGTVGTALSYQIAATNTPTSFNATGLPAGLSINTTTGVISGTPVTAGTTNVNISATNAGGTDTDVLAITIAPAPVVAPVITSTLTKSGISGTALNYQITASNTPTSYNATGLPAGLSINTTTGLISGTPTGSGTINVSISATNSAGTDTKTLVITVTVPVPVINSALTKAGNVGVALSYQIAATNTPTSFNATGLPAGLSINNTTGVISGTPSAIATTNVNISATNAGGTDTDVLVITIGAAPVVAPVISSTLTKSGLVGTALNYQITATNTPTSYNATGLPAGLSINTTSGLISGTPTGAAVSNVSISATNSAGTDTKSLVITVTVPVPVISSALTKSGNVGAALSYQITATNSPNSFNATGLPAGLSINTTTGVISGTPSAIGTTNVNISATNAGGTDTDVLVITIAAAPVVAPVINSTLSKSGVVGTALSYQITASNAPTSYNATNLPAGLTINTTSGLISGTPSAAATSNVSISATNSAGTDTKTLVITVSSAPTSAPVISSTLTKAGTVGTALSYQITASNTPTSFNATGLPAGLSINTTNGVISGTPTAAATTNVNISATNAGGTDTKVLVITIAPAPAVTPVITSTLTKSGLVGTTLNYQITATNTPTSYGATGLPAGLSINTTTGLISGTPTGAAVSNVTITATNTAGFDTKTLVITVTTPVPVISSALTKSGNVGTALTYQITATNTPTSFNATGLPAGLSINTTTGVISGTPGAVGTTNVNISATNAGGTDTDVLVITIAAAPVVAPVINSTLTKSGLVGAALNYQITATNTPGSYNATGLPAGLSINTTSGLISGTPTGAAVSNVSISATNTAGTDTKVLVITVTVPVPVISSALTKSGTVGTALSYQITASNTPTSFAATGLPAGLSINTTNGVISGTPTAAATTNVNISATNAGGTDTDVLVITVTAAPAVTPVINSTLTKSGIVGAALNYQITASNTPTSYSATGLPAGLSINTTSGLISGTPTATGVSNASISAGNTAGTDTKTLVITVTANAPVVTAPTPKSATVGTAFSYQIVATNAPTSYGATGLPAGLSVNTTTGLISGTPTAAGTVNVSISATNASGTDSDVLVINIVDNSAPLPPVISSVLTKSGVVGTALSYQIVASNTPTNYNAIGLPAELSIDNGTGLITGTPTAAATSNITISASNLAGADSKVLVLTVTAAPPTGKPVIDKSINQVFGTVGRPMTYSIKASNSPTSYDAAGLPNGLDIDTTTGVISGTPTDEKVDALVTIAASNSFGRTTATVFFHIYPQGSSNGLANGNATPICKRSGTATATGDLLDGWKSGSSDDAALDIAGHYNGVWTLSGQSKMMEGKADSYLAIWKEVAGDVTITACVGIASSNTEAFAGVMLRDSLDPAAQHASTVLVNREARGVSFMRRLTTSDTKTNNITSITAGTKAINGTWVKLERKGSTVSSYSSSDGTNWKLVRKESINFVNPAVLVGFVSSGEAGQDAVTATFSDVNVVGTTATPNSPAVATSGSTK
jgi:Putative Ig domain